MKNDQKENVLCLDVGERRIGVAWASLSLKIPFPLITLEVDNKIVNEIKDLADSQNTKMVVVGMPRNQRGEETAQSQTIRKFAKSLVEAGLEVEFQDESLTSVLAEEELNKSGKSFSKSDIDSLAATYILKDYLERLK